MEEFETRIEQRISQPCWIMDILPMRVPAKNNGQYSAVEHYYRHPDRLSLLHQKQAEILLKLNCYDNMSVSFDSSEWQDDPDPEWFVAKLKDLSFRNLRVLFPRLQILIDLDRDDTWLTIYPEHPEQFDLLERLATANGFFLWKAEQETAITVEEIPPDQIGSFWDAHLRYLIEDEIITGQEDIDYFSGDPYRHILEAHMERVPDTQHMAWFVRNHIRIGAASWCTFHSEDGKCFILDFWVFPPYRGDQAGHQCFHALEEYTWKDGAAYYALNSQKEDSVRFWKSLGFAEAGTDEYGMPVFVKRQPLKPFTYVKLTDHPQLKNAAARWFHEKWHVPEEAYLKCMNDCLNKVSDYDWYLCLDKGEIVGGLGVIDNDFHVRKDLRPNVCAVYTEEAYRSQGIAGTLLWMAAADMKSKGISPLYLLTDLSGFYERYGWEFYCLAQNEDSDEMSRLYIHR